jgi:alkylation response protein AidB-like acyl-CoA dehydrogenase
MPVYHAPVKDIQFTLHEVLNFLPTLQAASCLDGLDRATVDSIVEEAGRYCAGVLFPTNLPGDQQGCSFEPASHTVTPPPAFRRAYAQYVVGGWPALSLKAEHGGQGLPETLNQVLFEMLNAANQAWTMYPGLVHHAALCVQAYGSTAHREQVLPHLVSGNWGATMCLTEAHCGTDLGMLRTKAEPLADGVYKLTGSKIFISAGDHDFTENIVHLVLARLPDAPAGTKGISLFVVPKFHIQPDGSLGARNPIYCTGIEHKMGIKGSATCQMSLEGAVGTLIGEPHRGLQAMFVMMNAARLGVGNQSLGLMEIASQNAIAYARERAQGRSVKPGASSEAAPIIAHADVRRMLLTARAWTEAARTLVYFCGLQIDIAEAAKDEAERKTADDLLAILTPIAKAFITDNGWHVTSTCLQVFGGHGYVAEWGMEQFVRDARINMIYEGTNSVQAMDLLGRKVLADGGRRMQILGQVIAQECREHLAVPALAGFAKQVLSLLEQLQGQTLAIGARAIANPEEVGAAAVDYLRVCGHLVSGFCMLKVGRAALSGQASHDDPFYAGKLSLVRFYFERLMPECDSLLKLLAAGADNLDEAALMCA